ncbi:PAS domain S-box protein [Paucibacter sp. O1-1]|nr:PAS domain S-box protein [Paucibacter sp. O1-1]MDA3831203.1 PAS domain S-box protein [Paucibacter sp. O1-1]
MRNTQAMAASAAEFRILAESMPQIVWVTRPDGWHVHFNRHWMDYTGLSLEASLGNGWNPPFHPEDRERAAARWRQATESGEPYEIEYRLRRADGVYHWMLGRALPLRDSTGTIVKWFGTCTDIDELKQAQLHVDQSNRALLDSEQRYRSLFEQNNDGVYSLDLAGRIVSANDAFLNLIGYTAEDALSMDFLHFVAPERMTASAARFEQALSGEPVHFESVRVHRNGRRVEVDVDYQPLLVDGVISGVHGIVRDITQRKRATEMLYRQQEFLAALIENVTDGIVACDVDGSVTLSNRAVRDFRAREFEPRDRGAGSSPPSSISLMA